MHKTEWHLCWKENALNVCSIYAFHMYSSIKQCQNRLHSFTHVIQLRSMCCFLLETTVDWMHLNNTEYTRLVSPTYTHTHTHTSFTWYRSVLYSHVRPLTTICIWFVTPFTEFLCLFVVTSFFFSLHIFAHFFLSAKKTFILALSHFLALHIIESSCFVIFILEFSQHNMLLYLSNKEQ